MGFTRYEKHGKEEAKEERNRGWGIPVTGEMAQAGLYME